MYSLLLSLAFSSPKVSHVVQNLSDSNVRKKVSRKQKSLEKVGGSLIIVHREGIQTITHKKYKSEYTVHKFKILPIPFSLSVSLSHLSLRLWLGASPPPLRSNLLLTLTLTHEFNRLRYAFSLLKSELISLSDVFQNPSPFFFSASLRFLLCG